MQEGVFVEAGQLDLEEQDADGRLLEFVADFKLWLLSIELSNSIILASTQ